MHQFRRAALVPLKKGGEQYVLEAKPKGQHKSPPPAGTGDSSCVGPEPFRNFQKWFVLIVWACFSQSSYYMPTLRVLTLLLIQLLKTLQDVFALYLSWKWIRLVSLHLRWVGNILQFTEEWQKFHAIFKFQTNMQKKMIAKSYFHIIAN